MIYIFDNSFKRNTINLITKMKNYYLFSLFFMLFSMPSFSQTPSDVKKIIANYDLDKLKEKEIFYR